MITTITPSITIQESKTHNFLALTITDVNITNQLYTNQAGIYTLIFEDEGVNKVYIGETNNFNRRLSQHLTSTLKNKVIKKIYFFTTYNNYLDKSLLFEIESNLITRFNQDGGVILANDKQLNIYEDNENELVNLYVNLIYDYLMDKNITLIGTVKEDETVDVQDEGDVSMMQLKYLFELKNKNTNSNIKFDIDEELIIFAGTIIEVDIVKRLQVCEWLKDSDYYILNANNSNKFYIKLEQDILILEEDYNLIASFLN